MKCLRCGCKDTKVLDSRISDDNTKIRRRRECLNCGFRFTTYESYEKHTFYVIKSSGKREEYDRSKLVKSLKLCFAKRIDDESLIREVVEHLENKLEKFNADIKSDEISKIVLEELKEIDIISYIIYACNVYNFKTLDELNHLIDTIK